MKPQYVLLLLMISMFMGCSETKKEEETSSSKSEFIFLKPDQEKALGIELGNVNQESIAHEISVSGTIEAPPQSQYAVTAKTDAYVKEIKYYTGDLVQAGNVLCIIEHPKILEVQRDYRNVLTKWKQLEKQYKRAEELQQKNAISDREFEQIEADYQTETAQYQSLKASIKMIGLEPNQVEKNIIPQIIIKSPVSGIIGNILVKPGQFISAQQTIYELIKPEHLHLELSVFVSDLEKVSVGNHVDFFVPGSEHIRKAKVHLLAPTVGSEDRSAKIHAHLEGSSQGLTPGQLVSAKIYTQKSLQWVVNNTSLVNISSQWYLVEKTNKGYHLRKVKPGMRSSDKVAVEFEDGGKPNGPIVVSGVSYFIDQES
jgi:cobalt-zinc-cadmium efflux system membrane fusion protein